MHGVKQGLIAACNMVAGLVRWWLDTIGGLLPERSRRRLGFGQDWLWLDLDRNGEGAWRLAGDGLTAKEIPNALDRSVKPIQEGKLRLGVRMPRKSVLLRNLTLPPVAERDLDELLTHELARQLPFRAGDACFDFAVRGTDVQTGQLHVLVAACEQVAVDAVLGLCRSFRVEPAAVGVRGGDGPGTELNGLNLIRARSATSADKHALWPTAAAAVVFAVLLVASGVAELLQAQSQREAIEAAVAQARTQADSVRKLSTAVADLEGQLGILDRKKRESIRSAALEELTKALPDGTWLVRLQMGGQEVRIHGLGQDASSLVPRLEASPLFSNAKFRAPIIKSADGQLDRFDLSVELRQGKAP